MGNFTLVQNLLRTNYLASSLVLSHTQKNLPRSPFVLISNSMHNLISLPFLSLPDQLLGSCCLVTKSYPTLLRPPMDCSPQGSSLHGISQARIQEWVAIFFSRDFPDPGVPHASPALAGRFFTTAPPGKPPLGYCKSPHWSGFAFTHVFLQSVLYAAVEESIQNVCLRRLILCSKCYNGSPLYSVKVEICIIIWQALYDLACSLLLTLCILFSTTLPCCHYSREPCLLPLFLWSAIGTLSSQDLCSGCCLYLEYSALSRLHGCSPNFSNLTLMRLTLTTFFNTVI